MFIHFIWAIYFLLDKAKVSAPFTFTTLSAFTFFRHFYLFLLISFCSCGKITIYLYHYFSQKFNWLSSFKFFTHASIFIALLLFICRLIYLRYNTLFCLRFNLVKVSWGGDCVIWIDCYFNCDHVGKRAWFVEIC